MTRHRSEHDRRRTAGAKTRWVLDIRLLVGTLVAVAVIAGGGYLWRAYQVRRTAATLLERAEALAEEGRYGDAAGYLLRYLELCPGDAGNVPVKIRLAEVSDKAAKTGDAKRRAAELYAEALSVAPTDQAPALLGRLGELLLEIRDFGTAKLRAREILAMEQDSPQGWRVLALANYGQFRSAALTAKDSESACDAETAAGIQAGRPASVGKSLARAHQLNPGDIEVAETLAAVYRNYRNKPELVSDEQLGLSKATLTADERNAAAAAAGDRVMAELVAARPKDADAQLALYRHVIRYQVPQAKDQAELDLAVARARQAIVDALAYGPGDPRVLLAAADASRRDAMDAQRHGATDKAAKYYDDARKHLEAAIAKEFLEQAYLGLSGILVAQGETDRAVKILQRGIEHSHQESILLAWDLLDVLIGRGQKGDLLEAEKALATADGIVQKAGLASKLSLQRLTDLRRARLLVRQGQYAEAVPLLTALAAGQKAAGDEAAGGPSLITPQVIYEAWMLLGATHAQLKQWDQALTAYDEAAMRERSAAAPLVAAAAVCMAAERRAAAIRYCEKALAVPESAAVGAEAGRQMIYRQLIRLLDEEKRTADADRYRARLESQTAESARLTLEEVGRALRDKRLDEAFAIADRGVQARPEDALAHLALGEARSAKKEYAKAEAAFQKAAQLAPNDVRPLMELVQLYAEMNQAEKARHILEQAAENTKLTEVQRVLLPADGYAWLGDRKLAVAGYRKAVEASKGDPADQMRLAEFLLRGGDADDVAEAEKVLRGLMKQHDPARLRLAQLLVEQGGEEQWQEAQRLLESSTTEIGSERDRLLQARSLMVRGGKENLDRAQRLCEELLADSTKFGPGVHLMLAQIHRLQGRPEEARKQYRAVLDQDRPTASQMAIYIAFLLENGPPEEADERLKELEKLTADNLGTTALRGRWLRDQGRTKEIETLVEGLADRLLKRLDKDDPKQEAQVCQAIGDLYQGIEQYTAAQRWYRRLLKLAPDRYDSLAKALAEEGRVQDALAVCDEAGKTDKSARPAVTMTSVLLSGRATPEDLKLAEPQLKKALESYPDDLRLLANLAAVRVLQERADEAAALYRQILKQQPRHVATLNNLATLLSEQPEAEKRQEALKHIDQAIQLVGPKPGLLDTKGMLLVFNGQPEKAVELLKEAASVPRPDPRCCFHLAVAYDRLGDLEKARAALKQARNGRLERQVLTKMDRKLLAELEKKLGP